MDESKKHKTVEELGEIAKDLMRQARERGCLAVVVTVGADGIDSEGYRDGRLLYAYRHIGPEQEIDKLLARTAEDIVARRTLPKGGAGGSSTTVPVSEEVMGVCGGMSTLVTPLGSAMGYGSAGSSTSGFVGGGGSRSGSDPARKSP